MDKFKKMDGFAHERLIVIPPQIIENNRMNPAVNNLFITDIGYFPKALNHYRHREVGGRNYIFILCVGGKGTVEVGGQKFVMEKQTCCILPPDLKHTYYADEKEPWTIYWVHFNGVSGPAYVDYLLGASYVKTLDLSLVSRLITQFNQIYRLLEKGYSMDKMMAMSNMFGMFLSGINYDDQVQGGGGRQSDLINETIDYMNRHKGEKIALKTMAREMKISQSHLILRFKEQTGYTPIDYFLQMKIQYACQLLDTKDLTIGEVGYRVGYDDPFYFSRVFKKMMGKSPRDYRKVKKG